MRYDGRRRGTPLVATPPILAIVLVLGVAGAAQAGEGEWRLKVEPMHMQAFGHDQHVLNIHEIDLDGTPPTDTTTGINLDTDSGIAYRFELEYTRRQWGWGVDFFWFNTSQGAARLSLGGDGASGSTDQVVFEVADRSYSSSNPNELLYYDVLEDTDIAAWTVDLYGIRTLLGGPRSGLHLLFGIRSADFDNDYRAVVGVEGVGGSRLDASSNYDRMTGLMVGLTGDFHTGRHDITGSIGQSVVYGSVELQRTTREFTGPFGDNPSYVAQDVFRTERDIAVPITDFRIEWTYELSGIIGLGLGANTSVWWEVSVPPGVIPVDGGDAVLHENTIVFFGVLGVVELRF